MAGFRKSIIFFPILLLLLASPCLLRAGQTDRDRMLSSYENGDFEQSVKYANKAVRTPLSRLILDLSTLFLFRNRDDVVGSLLDLLDLHSETGLDRNIWLEASLSYARTVKNIRTRNLLEYRKFLSSADENAVFRELLSHAPESIHACYAAMELADPDCMSDDRGRINRGALFLENFIRSYPGPGQNLIMLHLYLDSIYVFGLGDYAKSYSHLEAAYQLGIEKDTLRENTLFRLGSIAYKRLGNNPAARIHFKKFIELYPASGLAPNVRRYLREMHG